MGPNATNQTLAHLDFGERLVRRHSSDFGGEGWAGGKRGGEKTRSLDALTPGILELLSAHRAPSVSFLGLPRLGLRSLHAAGVFFFF